MDSFQILYLCYLLVGISSDTSGTVFLKVECPQNVTAEQGKPVNFTCTTNKDIMIVTVKFCLEACPVKSYINKQNNFTADSGRISLEKERRSVVLKIGKVQISDQRKYFIYIYTDLGYRNKSIFLKVVAPYTQPNLTIKANDTLECNISGGYPERHIYWFTQHGTNVTHRSKLVSMKEKDGSFSLSSTLQRESSDNSMGYCCTLNNTMSFEGLACVSEQSAKAPIAEDQKSTMLPIVTLVPLATGICVVYWCWKKKGARTIPCQREQIAFLET